MRNRGLVKAMAKWAGLWEETRRAKLYLLDVYEQTCRAQNMPALGLTVVRRLLFGPGYYAAAAVDLSGISWGPAGARAFGCVMKGVDLRGEPLESPSMLRVREYCGGRGFEAIRCAACRLSSEGARELAGTVAACKIALTALDISANDLGPGGAESLVALLGCRTCPLRRLAADDNALGDSGVAAIAGAARDSETLAHLSLRKNHAAVSAGSALGKMLKANSTLVELDLLGNDIHGAGASELADGLVANTSLTRLNLSRNSFGGSKAMRALSRGLRNCALETLDMSDNHIGDESVPAFLDGLKVNQTLRRVILDGNPIQMNGARELLKCVGFNADGTVARTISLRNCSYQVAVPCLLNPSEPVGFYSLHMQEEYALPVMQYLISLQQKGDFGFDSGVGTLISRPDQHKNTQKQSKCKVDLNYNGDPKTWKYPGTGILEFLYVDKSIHAVERAAAAKAVVEILRQYTSNSYDPQPTKQDALIDSNEDEAVGSGYYAFERLVEKLSFIPGHETRKRLRLLAASLQDLLSDKDYRIYPLLVQEQNQLIQDMLRIKPENSLFSFSSGHYKIDLAIPELRNIVMRLQTLKNSMMQEEGDLLESLQERGMSLEDLESIELVWKHSKMNEKPIKYSDLWVIPHQGILQFDFVDIRRPGSDQKIMSDLEFRTLIMEKWESTSKLLKLALMQPKKKLLMLQEISVTRYFSCAQVAEMISHFSPVENSYIRSEIYVLCWSRTVDWHGLRNLFYVLTPFERKVVQYRLGALVLFDEMMAVGYYELDLGVIEERFVFRELFTLIKTEPGSEILYTTLNGAEWNIPADWSDSAIPLNGYITFYFARGSDVLEKVLQQGAFSHSRNIPYKASLSTFCEQWMKHSCHGHLSSPSGSAWIVECMRRNIALKLTQEFGSADEVLSKMQISDGHTNFMLKNLHRVLNSSCIWFYPFELQELNRVLNSDHDGSVEICVFTSFWRDYAACQFLKSM